jgi:hypothetical protein
MTKMRTPSTKFKLYLKRGLKISIAILILYVVLSNVVSFIGQFHYLIFRSDPAYACINNLRQIDAAANEFALVAHLTNGDAIHFPDDLTPYIKLNSAGKIPSCPSGGIYSIQKVGVLPVCSLGTTVTPAHFLPP